MTDHCDPLPDHAPADKFVFKELRKADEPLTRLEVQQVTYLNGRTVRRALARLRETGHVEKQLGFDKPRYVVAGQNVQPRGD